MATNSNRAQSEVENDTPIHRRTTGRAREARIGKVDGEPLGAPLYFTAAELRELGADLDSEKIVFSVGGGELRIE